MVEYFLGSHSCVLTRFRKCFYLGKNRDIFILEVISKLLLYQIFGVTSNMKGLRQPVLSHLTGVPEPVWWTHLLGRDPIGARTFHLNRLKTFTSELCKL